MSNKTEFKELFFSKTKDFLDVFLKKQEDRSSDTVKAYRISLTAFYVYVTVIKGISVMAFRFEDCTYEFVLSYSQYLQEEKGLSNSTVISQICSRRRYLTDADLYGS